MELNINHHTAEPINTPKAIAVEWKKSAVEEEAKPSPAKIAMKDNIVEGLVRVKKKVEMKLSGATLKIRRVP